MLKLRFLISASLLALSTAWSGAALADVPPPDACTSSSQAGAPCNNAGSAADEPGTCESSMCSHVGPGADGGIVTSMYPCMICTASSSSSSSGGTTTGTGGGTSSGGGTSGGGSCAFGTAGREGAVTGTLVLIGLAAALAGRRPRRKR
jgi:uncharacterized membrane protein YgcG